MRRALLLYSIIAVAACGGTTTRTSSATFTSVPNTFNGVPITEDTVFDNDADQEETAAETDARLGFSYQDFVNIADATFEPAFQNALNSSFDAIPISGSAEFDGILSIKVIDGPEVDRVSSDGTLTTSDGEFFSISLITIDANFGTNMVNAEVNATFGYNEDDSNLLEAYEGDITLADGTIGASRPNDIGFTIEGSVSDGADIVQISAPFAGKFIGSPIAGIRIESGVGDLAVVTLNGEVAESSFLGLDAVPR